VKKAVRRNYYKRQIKNILVEHKNICQTLPNHYNLVIITRHGFLTTQDFSTKQKSLGELLNTIFQKEIQPNSSPHKKIVYA